MTRPFADAVPFYRQAGWLGTLPLPPRAKHNPPDGWTGAHERDPDDATVAYWAANGQASGNIALRMPGDVIGLDVDAYDAWRPVRDPATGQTVTKLVHKRGAETLTELESALGPLPPTWISSARPAPSGIRLFRVPTGYTITESALPGDIEIVRRGHRYMVAPPSVNPETGTTYGWWFGATGTAWSAPGRPPRRDEVPELPGAWAVRLSARPAVAPQFVPDFFQPAKTAPTAARQWDRLRDRTIGFVRRCEMFGWGGDAHGTLLELTRELAQLAPADAHRAIGEWWQAAGAGFVDWRVWAMLDSALGKYPADKIVAAGPDVLPVSSVATDLPPSYGSVPTATMVPGRQAEAGVSLLAGSGGPTAGPMDHRPEQQLPDRPAETTVAASGSVAHNAPMTDTHVSEVPDGGNAPRRLPMIPDAVWDSYGWTRSIRAQARAANVCPDAVLGAMLAAYASRIPPGLRIDTGTKMPLGCNLVVSLVGPSGSDKSTAFGLAQRMMPGSAVPVINNPGSGEAFAATFTHPDPDYDGPAKQRPKVLKPDPRALFYVAEGALVGSVGARLGSTWLPHLRSLAVDESLSTSNATAEINRQVPAMSYRAGVVVGFQVVNAATILHDTGTGTAQRFLWFTSLSSEPRGLPAEAPHVPMATPVLTRFGGGIDENNEVIHTIAVTRTITDRIVAEQEHTRLHRDITATDDHDAHRHTLLAKLAAIAVLADDRVMIEPPDWAWAEALYAASSATRDVLLEVAEETERTERVAAGARLAESDRARKGYDASEVRVAEVILRAVDRLGEAARRDIGHAVASRDRSLLGGALDQLVAHGYLVRGANGRYRRASQG